MQRLQNEYSITNLEDIYFYSVEVIIDSEAFVSECSCSDLMHGSRIYFFVLRVWFSFAVLKCETFPVGALADLITSLVDSSSLRRKTRHRLLCM